MRALVRITVRICSLVLLAPLLLNAGFSVRPIVNIVAADAFANENPAAAQSGPPAATRNAVFVVSRGWASSKSLTVFYAIRGTASNGGDYQRLHGSVTIPAGRRSARIVVEPIADPQPEVDPKTVILSLKANGSYTLGPKTGAKAFIADYVHREFPGFVGPGQGSID